MATAPLCRICNSRHWGGDQVWADEPRKPIERKPIETIITYEQVNAALDREFGPKPTKEPFDRKAYQKAYMKDYMKFYRKRKKEEKAK